MPETDVVALLDRLLDEDPYQPGIDELMQVAGDLLQARGHERGELIALEQALAAADHATRSQRAAELQRWLQDHQVGMFGQAFASFSRKRGALRLTTRGGRLRGLFIDARRIDHEGLDVAQMLASLIGSHGARRLVELRVRVPTLAQLGHVHAVLEQLPRRPPLEFVCASPTTRPIGHQLNGHPTRLRELLPRLWFATQAGQIALIHDRNLDEERSAAELDGFAGAPMSRELRIHIGRALSSGRKRSTEAGLRLLAGLGDSGRVFLPALRMLLAPGVSPAARWLLPALARLGPWARELRPIVARMTGDARRYGEPLRSLAGRSLAGFAETAKPSQARA